MNNHIHCDLHIRSYTSLIRDFGKINILKYKSAILLALRLIAYHTHESAV